MSHADKAPKSYMYCTPVLSCLDKVYNNSFSTELANNLRLYLLVSGMLVILRLYITSGWAYFSRTISWTFARRRSYLLALYCDSREETLSIFTLQTVGF